MCCRALYAVLAPQWAAQQQPALIAVYLTSSLTWAGGGDRGGAILRLRCSILSAGHNGSLTWAAVGSGHILAVLIQQQLYATLAALMQQQRACRWQACMGLSSSPKSATVEFKQGAWPAERPSCCSALCRPGRFAAAGARDSCGQLSCTVQEAPKCLQPLLLPDATVSCRRRGWLT